MNNSCSERVAPPMVLPRTDSLRWCAAAFLAALVLFSRAPGLALLAEESKEVQRFALLKGSCFDQRGFSLPGVAILVTLPPEESGKKKEKRWRMQSDRRGEFACASSRRRTDRGGDRQKEGLPGGREIRSVLWR